MVEYRCPVCGKPVLPNFKFCKACGARLSKSVFQKKREPEPQRDIHSSSMSFGSEVDDSAEAVVLDQEIVHALAIKGRLVVIDREMEEILEEIGSQHAAHLTDTAARRVREASKKFMIFYSRLTPTVYTSVKDHGVMLTIRYLCDPRERRGTEQAIWENILTEFGQADDIDFAYPTVRRYDNRREGKPGTRPDTGEPDLMT